jgi:Glycosyltransferase 61
MRKEAMKEKLNYNHVKFQISKRWYGEASISDIASECIELCPPETGEGSRAIYLPDQLDKVVRPAPESNIELEKSRIGAGPRQHMPTVAYKINDAYISSTAIYKKNFCSRYPVSNFSQPVLGGTPVDPSQPLSMTSSWTGVKYFGHWLLENVPTYMLAKDFGTPISMRTGVWADKARYGQLFQQSWNQYYTGKVSTLYLFQDFSENSLKVKRYRALRTALRQALRPKYGDHLVYLKRGGGGANVRKIVNEAELVEALANKNFKIVDLEKDPVESVIAQLLDAKLVVTLEGSHANHANYTLADDGGVLFLMAPRLFTNMNKGWTDAMGLDYGFVVGDDIDDNSFSMDISNVLKTIDLML